MSDTPGTPSRSSPAHMSSPANGSLCRPNSNTPSRPDRRRDVALEDFTALPRDNQEYNAAFMNADANNELDHTSAPAGPLPWVDPAQSWRYVGDQVWTGSEFVYAPRPTIPINTTTAIPSPRGARSTYPGPPLQFGVAAHGSFYGPQGPATSGFTHALQGTPTSEYTRASATPSPSPAPALGAGPRDVRAWSDEEILRLYKWKVVKKKGANTIAQDFPGETEASINTAWRWYRKEGEALYDQEVKKRRKKKR